MKIDITLTENYISVLAIMWCVITIMLLILRLTKIAKVNHLTLTRVDEDIVDQKVKNSYYSLIHGPNTIVNDRNYGMYEITVITKIGALSRPTSEVFAASSHDKATGIEKSLYEAYRKKINS